MFMDTPTIIRQVYAGIGGSMSEVGTDCVPGPLSCVLEKVVASTTTCALNKPPPAITQGDRTGPGRRATLFARALPRPSAAECDAALFTIFSIIRWPRAAPRSTHPPTPWNFA